MNILTACQAEAKANFRCAQGGCERCMEYLLGRHEGLVHAVIRRVEIGGVSYREAVQEGRIGLWRAILGYDPERGTAFSSYAWRSIERHLWRYVGIYGQARQGLEEEPYETDLAERAWEEKQVAAALHEELELLPERLKGVIEQVYGLGEQPPQKMAELGRQMGVSRERVRQLRNDGLALLRLPALSVEVRSLSGRDSRKDYRQARRDSNAWLGRHRRGK